MVTHDDELAARAPRTIVLADGLIVDKIARGPNTFTDTADPMVGDRGEYGRIPYHALPHSGS